MNQKQFLAAAAAGVLLCTGTVFHASAALRMCEATLPGDADASGSVDGRDITALSDFLLQRKADISVNADLNGDGIVDGFDLALLKAMYSGSFTPENYGALVINEVCASNQSSLLDAAGNSPDWVELYNPTETAISLSGFGLSDGKKDLFKFTFPEDAVIPAGGYVIVFCDDGTSQTQGEYHAGFKISASGETIYLTHPFNGTVDAVEVPALDTDTVYGRYTNGSDSFSILTPTPGRSNDETSGAVDWVAAPVFSRESGFYDDAFSLELSGTENEIYYTTDGTDPRTSSTAKLYTGGISIYNNTGDQNVFSAVSDISLEQYSGPSGSVDKGIIVRAVSRNTAGSYSDVVTGSYFIGKTASYYKNMKVVSIVTDPDNLFSSEDGIYVVGDAFYTWKNSSSYKQLDTWSNDNPTNYNQTGREWEREASVQIFENGSLAYENGVGIRIAGHATRVNFQKSIRLYARSEYGDSKMQYDFFPGLTDVNGEAITSYDKVTLRNGGNDISTTRFRDDLVQSLVADRDLSVQASENAVVFIDGEFWGFYTIKERMDDEYIASHYGVDKKNVTTVKIGETDGDETVTQSYIDFYSWAMAADMSDSDNYQRVCDTIDIQSFMDYITVESYICNYDFSNLKNMNNWQMWRTNTVEEGNPYGDGKWRFMLYDTEYSSGLYDLTETSYSYNMLNNMCREEEWTNLTSLFYHLLDNEDFCTQFEATYREIVETNFAYDKVDAQITSYYSAQQQVMRDTNLRFYGYTASWYNNQYDSNIQTLRNFYRNRPTYALQYLEKLMSGDTEQTTTESGNQDQWGWGWNWQ